MVARYPPGPVGASAVEWLREVYLLLWERCCADWSGLGRYAARYHRRLMRAALWLLSNLLYEATWGCDRSDLEERDMADDTPGSLFGLCYECP